MVTPKCLIFKDMLHSPGKLEDFVTKQDLSKL